MKIVYIGVCEAVENSFGIFKKGDMKEVSEEIGKILLSDSDNWKGAKQEKKKIRKEG